MISTQEYQRRRQAMIQAIGEQGAAIFVAPPERTRSHDTSYPYRASSDILYLTGFDEPEAVLVLSPGHEHGDYVLFVRERDPMREQWNGRRAGPQGAIERFGADAAFTLDRLAELLPELIAHRQTLYYTLNQSIEFDQRLLNMISALRSRRNAPSAAPTQLVDVRDLLHRQRQIKSAEEIEQMQRAATITAQAHELAMRACRPGMMEYEIEALIEFHFKRHGASFPAYTSIVGGGDNATILHYIENNQRLEAGQLLLVDAGCELNHYAADITRTYPVDGRFTPAQRDLYQAILEVQLKSIEECAPGLVYQEIQTRASRRLTEALVQLKLLSGSLDELVESQAYKKYYPHGAGHWLGIDVHDVGPYFDRDGQGILLTPGHVITIEPGLYIPAHDEDAPEELRGVGIRIEDDILITESGYVNLTQACPKEIDALEAIVGAGVTLQL